MKLQLGRVRDLTFPKTVFYKVRYNLLVFKPVGGKNGWDYGLGGLAIAFGNAFLGAMLAWFVRRYGRFNLALLLLESGQHAVFSERRYARTVYCNPDSERIYQGPVCGANR